VFSILIPTWNNLPHLQLLIQSLQKNSFQEHELVVHVNDGSDGTLEWVKSQGLKYTHSTTNIGICEAVNLAATLSTGDQIVYMNDDMYVCPDWDRPLLEKIKELPTVWYMLSGTLIEPKSTGNACVVVRDFGDSVESFDEERLLEQYHLLNRTDWMGATWPPTVVSREAWFRIGGYSVEFSPGMGSDNDFSMKLWKAGCRHFIGIGTSLIYHFQMKSTGKVVRNDGRRQFILKWGLSQRDFDRHILRRGESAQSGTPTIGVRAEAITPYITWKWRLQRAWMALRTAP
jgi:GT2 family glycosyltransferase